jgi:hypothetical protein
MNGWFVAFALILPRCTLLIAYVLGVIPENSTPLLLDVVTAMVAPRWLIAWWLHEAGWHPVWSVLFVVLGAGTTSGEQAVAIEAAAPSSGDEPIIRRTPWDFRRPRRIRSFFGKASDSPNDSEP